MSELTHAFTHREKQDERAAQKHEKKTPQHRSDTLTLSTHSLLSTRPPLLALPHLTHMYDTFDFSERSFLR